MVESSPSPSPPSPEEQRGYYCGLPSCPKLIARSSTIPWSPQYDGWSIPKCLYVVGEHAIAELWNDADSSLRRQILQVVDRVDWTAIDVLRVGYARDNGWTGERFRRPVTILISVRACSTSFEQGSRVVAACSRILEDHDLDDVQVEMKESEVRRAALASPLAPLSTPAISTSSQATSSQLLQFSSRDLAEPVSWTILLSEYLGLPIAPSDAPKHQGTKCIYLRCGARVFALTCRHVVFKNLPPNTRYQHDDTTIPHTVMQPDDRTWMDVTNLAPIKTNDDQQELDELKEKFQQGVWKGKTEQSRLQALIQISQTEVDANEAWNERIPEWDNPSSRILGHTAFSPAYSLGPIPGSKEERLRDWALIELHQDKHATPLTSLPNRVYLGPGGQAFIKKRALKWTRIRRFQAYYDEHGVTLSGTIPETEMRGPCPSSIDDETGIFVIKYGPASELTTGISNRIKSLTRWPCPGGGEYRSEEWCIVGHGRGDDRVAFSADGDSGSCVFDIQGRVGGMLTGGLGREDFGHDVSYVTPMEWLLEDIRRHGYDVELL